MGKLRRLLFVLLAAASAGMLFGHTTAFISLGLLLYIVWLHKSIDRLLSHLRNKNPDAEYTFDGVMHDIVSEFDRVRHHHHERDRRLLGELRRFQVAASAIPDAVVLLGKYGRIDWANKKAGEYLGILWPRDDGHRISNLLRMPELNRFVQEQRVRETDERLEFTLSYKQERHLEFRVIPYGDDQRLLVARDITEIYQTNTMRKDFIANASHELRTPLTVVAGYLEALESEDDAAQISTWRANIVKMRAHTLRMQRLINDLLKLSSLESTHSDRRHEEVVVAEMLSSVFNEARSLSGEKDHIFYLETDPNLWLKGNPQELYSAFSNLVFNAVQYTPPRGVIRVRWNASDDGARMEVVDSGEGIAAEHLPRLTERFYRVDAGRSRQEGGTGLGLAIVKHVLANHGARLDIHSDPGKGSRFTCCFPRDRIIIKPDAETTSLSA